MDDLWALAASNLFTAIAPFQRGARWWLTRLLMLAGGLLGDAGNPRAQFSMDLLSNFRNACQLIIYWAMVILTFPPQYSHSIVMQAFDWAKQDEADLEGFSPLFSLFYTLTDCIAMMHMNFLNDTYFKWKLQTTEKKASERERESKEKSRGKEKTAFEKFRIHEQDCTLYIHLIWSTMDIITYIPPPLVPFPK